EDVDRAELGNRLVHHSGDRTPLAHVRIVVADDHPVVGGKLRTHEFDLVGIAEAVQNNVAALGREGFGDALADAAGRACDECRLSSEHRRFLRLEPWPEGWHWLRA